MSGPKDPISPYEISRTEGLDDWRQVRDALSTRLDTGDFATGAKLVQQIADVADELNHHPDVDLQYGALFVRTKSHDVDAITARDVALARRISELAAAAGVQARAESTSTFELGIDVVDADAVRPFWLALTGGKEINGEVVDPTGHHPLIWFQGMDPPRTQRNRIHVDLTVPHDVAEQRVAAAIAAGGRLVTDQYAPAWWVLADPEGNEACVCTWRGRGNSGEP